MYLFCLKEDLFDQANELIKHKSLQTTEYRQKSYQLMADTFSRPFYMKQKYEIAMKYPRHPSLAIYEALKKVNLAQVFEGNLNGINAALMLLDLLNSLRKSTPLYNHTRTFWEQMLEQLIQFCESEKAQKCAINKETLKFLGQIGEVRLLQTKWVRAQVFCQPWSIRKQTVPYSLTFANKVPKDPTSQIGNLQTFR
jgi:hypothetical protein